MARSRIADGISYPVDINSMGVFVLVVPVRIRERSYVYLSGLYAVAFVRDADILRALIPREGAGAICSLVKPAFPSFKFLKVAHPERGDCTADSNDVVFCR